MNYYYDYTTPTQVSGLQGIINTIMASFVIVAVIFGIIGIVTIVALWKIFKKAGKNGWEAIVPIYNIIVLLEIVELPMWYIVLNIIPIANIYAMFKMYTGLAHKFGKSTGFGVATMFFPMVCLPILAFSDAQFEGGIIYSQNYQSNVNYGQYSGAYQQTNQQSYNQQGYDQNMNYDQTQTNNQFVQNNDYQQPTAQNVQQTYSQGMNYNQTQSNNQFIQNNGYQQLNTQNVQQTYSQDMGNSQPVQNTKKTCPNCGNQVHADSAGCFMCGYKF